jgi:5-methylcytosine-specific restriction protein A
MPTRRCLDCPALIRRGSRCVACDQRHRLGWVWSKVRNGWLETHPTCVRCRAPAEQVDHVLPRAAGGRHDQGNLQSLCLACHRSKTASDAGLGLNVAGAVR